MRLNKTMSENTEFVTLKQGDTVIQNKFTKDELKRVSRKLEIAVTVGLLLALALLMVARSYFSITETVSPSMVPTLSVGDISLYGPVGEISRGEIILFLPKTDENANLPVIINSEGDKFTKRVIGLPGERIRMEDGIVYINGEALDEPYTIYSDNPNPYALMNRDLDEITIPEGCYFVMGDNRDNSSDSRLFGVIPRENIICSRIFSFTSISGWITGVSNDELFI